MNRFSMLKLIHSIGVIAAALAVTLVAPAPAACAARTSASAKALVKLDDEWSRAAATKDVERVASFYAADAIAYPPNEPVAVGRAAARKVWASYFAAPNFSISWKTAHAGVSQSGDLGFTAGTYKDSFRGPDGKMVMEKGKYVCTWKKQKDGSWKAIHDIWNSDSK